jgi:signal peptidase I
MNPQQNKSEPVAGPAGNGSVGPQKPKFPTIRSYLDTTSSNKPSWANLNNSNQGSTGKPQRRWHDILSTISLLALAPIIALMIILFAIQSYQVDGQSMEPTLQNRDRLIVNKIPRSLARITGHAYIPHRGDIIIFNQTNLPGAAQGQSKQLIKRVIGLPGDRVVVKDGRITIYNQTNPGGFNPDAGGGYQIASKTTPGNAEVAVEEGQIYVCGDNRPNSEDSRFFGTVPANQIVGKLILRLLPINKAEAF